MILASFRGRFPVPVGSDCFSSCPELFHPASWLLTFLSPLHGWVFHYFTISVCPLLGFESLRAAPATLREPVTARILSTAGKTVLVTALHRKLTGHPDRLSLVIEDHPFVTGIHQPCSCPVKVQVVTNLAGTG